MQGIMNLRSSAEAVRARGRYGDDVLVHMSASELENISAMMPRDYTINPETGLPEMFEFIDLLPIAGMLVGGFFGGPGGAALGGAAGGALAGGFREDGSAEGALQGGIMGGLTGYFGGAALGGAFPATFGGSLGAAGGGALAGAGSGGMFAGMGATGGGGGIAGAGGGGMFAGMGSLGGLGGGAAAGSGGGGSMATMGAVNNPLISQGSDNNLMGGLGNLLNNPMAMLSVLGAGAGLSSDDIEDKRKLDFSAPNLPSEPPDRPRRELPVNYSPGFDPEELYFDGQQFAEGGPVNANKYAGGGIMDMMTAPFRIDRLFSTDTVGMFGLPAFLDPEAAMGLPLATSMGYGPDARSQKEKDKIASREALAKYNEFRYADGGIVDVGLVNVPRAFIPSNNFSNAQKTPASNIINIPEARISGSIDTSSIDTSQWPFTARQITSPTTQNIEPEPDVPTEPASPPPTAPPPTAPPTTSHLSTVPVANPAPLPAPVGGGSPPPTPLVFANSSGELTSDPEVIRNAGLGGSSSLIGAPGISPQQLASAGLGGNTPWWELDTLADPYDYSTYANGGIVNVRKYANGGIIPHPQPTPQAPNQDANALIEETKQAILGTHPDPQRVVALFIETFGQEAFDQLKQQVVAEQQQAPSGPQGAGTQLTSGPGGGLGDQIPATIEGQEPARLSDGEYVVPADVVSGLGDGSTNEGERRLAQMVSGVRQKRGGSPVQPAQIGLDIIPQ